jgi:hypothetical protein
MTPVSRSSRSHLPAPTTQQVVELYAACSDPAFDILSVRQVSNPRLTGAFHHRLVQLQTRSGNPVFRARYLSEPHPQQRAAIVDAVETRARPFADPSVPDVTILPV